MNEQNWWIQKISHEKCQSESSCFEIVFSIWRSTFPLTRNDFFVLFFGLFKKIVTKIRFGSMKFESIKRVTAD